MEEWVVLESRRQWPAWWRTERREQRFNFLDSGVVMLAQRQRSVQGNDVDSQRSPLTPSQRQQQQQQQRRRRSRIEVGTWWFDKAGLRWDVTYKYKTSPGGNTAVGSSTESVSSHGSGAHGSSSSNSDNGNGVSFAPLTRQYSAVHNENVFGARPRLVCGVITQDRRSIAQKRDRLRQAQEIRVDDARAQKRASSSDISEVALVTNPAATKRRWQLPPWAFRPVIGTFTGYGDSTDTHDPDYAMRDGW